MNRIIPILALLTAVVFIISCSHPNRKFIHEIHQLQKQVDSIQHAFELMDIEYFNNINKEIQQNMTFLQANTAKVDMSDTAISKYIGAYGTLWKTLGRTYKRGAADLEMKIQESKKQLDNLEYDVKNKILTNPDVITTFISSESKEVVRLKLIVANASGEFVLHRERYISLQPKVDSIIKNIKQK